MKVFSQKICRIGSIFYYRYCNLFYMQLLEEHTVLPHMPEVALEAYILPAPSCDAIVTSEYTIITTTATKGTQCTQKKCVHIKSESEHI